MGICIIVNGDTFSFLFLESLWCGLFSHLEAQEKCINVNTSPGKKYSIHASAATFFIGIMVGFYNGAGRHIAGIRLLIKIEYDGQIQIINELF